MPIRLCRVLLVLAVVGVGAFGATPGVGAQEEDFDRIAAETAAARGFAPLPEITEVFLTPDELRQRLPELVAEGYPTEEAEAEARAWAALGLVPAGEDLEALFIDLLGEQVAGYYDPETDEMVVIGGADDLSASEEFTYSHETVHALQDAYLGLGEIVDDETAVSDDEALAVTSLYEGDAVVGSLAYLGGHPLLAARLLFEELPETPQIDQVPPAIAVWLLFPYVGGQGFVEALRAQGGWEAVNAAYRDLPTSTEQILHPEKYLERDDPTPVSLPDPAAILGAGWAPVDEDTLGELQTAVLLADLKPGQGFSGLTGALDLPEAAQNAAAGWDGDRYALWASGDQEVLVWRSVWDSDEDAIAFSRALQTYAEGRFGGVFEGGSPDDVAISAPDQVARIVRDGATVSYVLAPSLDLADRAMAVLRQA